MNDEKCSDLLVISCSVHGCRFTLYLRIAHRGFLLTTRVNRRASITEALLRHLHDKLAGIGQDYIVNIHCCVVLLLTVDGDFLPHLSFTARWISDFPELA